MFFLFLLFFLHVEAEVKLPFCISKTKCTKNSCSLEFMSDNMPNADVRIELMYDRKTTFHLILKKMGDQIPFLPPDLYQDLAEFRYRVDDAELDQKTLIPFEVPYLSETISPLYFDRGDFVYQMDENGNLTFIRNCPILFFLPLNAGVRVCIDVVKINDELEVKQSKSLPQIVKGFQFKPQGIPGEDFFVAATYKARFTKNGKKCNKFEAEKDNLPIEMD